MKIQNQFQIDCKNFGDDDTAKRLIRARKDLHKAGFDSLAYRVTIELKKVFIKLNNEEADLKAAHEKDDAEQLAGETRYRQSVLADQ